MDNLKQIVCLANSRKLSGRCVAGKELISEGKSVWLRPVSARASEEVSEWERQYEDGSDPRLLDIIGVPLLGPKPKPYQPENWLLDSTRYWERMGRVNWNNLKDFQDRPQLLWENESSSNNGLFDRVPFANAVGVDSSLYLLYLGGLRLSVFAPGAAFGNQKRRVQAKFIYRRISYALWVTDPDIEREYLSRENGEYALGECYIAVSLGESYEGYCYKLVAAIVLPQRG